MKKQPKKKKNDEQEQITKTWTITTKSRARKPQKPVTRDEHPHEDISAGTQRWWGRVVQEKTPTLEKINGPPPVNNNLLFALPDPRVFLVDRNTCKSGTPFHTPCPTPLFPEAAPP